MTGRPLAFLVLSHDDPAMLERLCARLAPHPVYVHVDAKAQDMAAPCADQPHVQVSAVRRSIHWADFAMVEATLDLVAMAQADGFARHTMLLSGHCYPLRPVQRLADHLAAQGDVDLIQMVRIADGSHLGNLVGRHWRQRPYLPTRVRRASARLARLDDLARRLRNRAARSVGRDFRAETAAVPVHGSQWWALSRPSLDAVLALDSARPQLRRAMETCFAPDELFFQTLLAASERAGHQVGSTEDWGEAGLYNAPLTYVYPSEARWVVDDAATRDAMVASGKFFARKIRSDQTALLDWIDRDLLRIDGEAA